jgi:molybdate transport system permease protein
MRLLPAAAIAVATALLFALLALPVAALFLHTSPRELIRQLGEPVVLEALRLSLVTSTGATLVVVVLGLPAAYLLATRSFPGKRMVDALVNLPMVLPPTVAGLALLLAFGRAGLLGGALEVLGVRLPFTTLGVVVAQAFMAAPFFVAPCRAGIAAVEPRYLDMAKTLRGGEGYTFFRVVLPLSLPSLVAGAAMAWARALGEFGATITFAGNLAGRTQTMPLAVYVRLQTDLDAAVALSVVLVAVAFALLLGLQLAPVMPFWKRADAGR